MTSTDRFRNEQVFHDAQAAARAETFATHPARLRFEDDEYLDHESWIRPAFARIGDVAGQRVLDWGCGHGMAAVVFAHRGAIVSACDLSGGYVRETLARAAANGVSLQSLQADAQRLPFADATFDSVWGHAILHHLDVGAASRELQRVLRPGGIAVLCEPWAENPVLRVARRWIPYAGKHQTADESPLCAQDLETIRGHFESIEIEGFQLLSMLRRVVERPRFRSLLERGDARLFERWPSLRRFGRYVVIALRR